MRVVFAVTLSCFWSGFSPGALRAQQPPQAGRVVSETTTVSVSGRDVRVESGRLWVPEYRADPTSQLIRLAYVKLTTFAAEPRAPIFYLAGGPGGSATATASGPNAITGWVPYLEIGDVVLLDQRGAGQSERFLRFPASSVPEDVLVSRESAVRHIAETTRAAAEHFRARGVALEGYTSNEAADDIDALRRALGYEKISLLGFSYGTHLALATIRRHEAAIADVVLCGVEGLDETHKLPLDMDVQFRKVSRMVADDPRVGSYVPDMVALYQRVVEKLARAPMVVEIPQPGGSKQVPVGPWGLQLILRFDIGDASDLPVFPRLLYSIDRGDPSVLRWFVARRYVIFSGANLMSTFTDGSAGASPERWATIRAQTRESMFGDVTVLPWPAVDTAAGVADLGPEYRAPLVSDVRTLLLSGSLDWNTPPYHAERLRWGLRNAVHLSVENAGHEQVLPQPAIQRAILAFLKGDDVRDVRVALPPLRFVPIEGDDPSVTHPSVRSR